MPMSALMARAAVGALVVVATLLIVGPAAPARAGKPSRPALVSGVVWLDADRDGMRERGERRVSGVVAVLQRSIGRRGFARVARDRTDARGLWSFKVRRAGRYRVRIAIPAGLQGFAPARRGASRGRDSDVGATGMTPKVRLRPGGASRRFDAGLLAAPPAPPPPLPPPSGAPPTPPHVPQPFTVTGFVWEERNGDGYRSAPNEDGIPNLTVEAWNAAKTQLLASTTTNAFGGFELTVPDRVDYRLRVVPGGGAYSALVRPNQGLDDALDSDFEWAGPDQGFTPIYPAAVPATNVGAGLAIPINVGNFVWHDENADGDQDGSEPGVAGVTVELWDGAKTTLLGTATTNANGNYALHAPGPGQYRVRVLPPPGALFSPKNAAADDLVDSDVNTVGVNAGFTDVYTFAPNLISITSIDAGLI
jgi:SdrD B-like domain